jgi:hypothetical protein
MTVSNALTRSAHTRWVALEFRRCVRSLTHRPPLLQAAPGAHSAEPVTGHTNGSESVPVIPKTSVCAAGKAPTCREGTDATETLPRTHLANAATRSVPAVARRDIVSVVADFSSGAAAGTPLNACSGRLSPPSADSQRPLRADDPRHAIARRWRWRCTHRGGTGIGNQGIYASVARGVDVSAGVARGVDTCVDGHGCAAATAGRGIGAEREKQVLGIRVDVMHVVPKGSQRGWTLLLRKPGAPQRHGVCFARPCRCRRTKR